MEQKVGGLQPVQRRGARSGKGTSEKGMLLPRWVSEGREEALGPSFPGAQQRTLFFSSGVRCPKRNDSPHPG